MLTLKLTYQNTVTIASQVPPMRISVGNQY